MPYGCSRWLHELRDEHIRAIRDLKGKRIAVSAIGSLEYYFLASMMAYVGLDPRRDIVWVDSKSFDGMRRDFIEKRVDAFFAFPPQPQELREKKIGRVIVNTAQDRPWDQYYCCMIVARPEFVRQYPIATKRAVRAIPLRPPTSVRRIPSERRSTWSAGLSQIRDRAGRREVAFLHPLAYPQSGGLVALPWSAVVRRGMIKTAPQAHCSRYRLAVLERVEEGAESMRCE